MIRVEMHLRHADRLRHADPLLVGTPGQRVVHWIDLCLALELGSPGERLRAAAYMLDCLYEVDAA